MGTQLERWRESLDKALHDKNQPWADALEWAEGKTGIKRVYLFLAYRSIKALETPNKDDDTKWLTYWVVFALFSIIEYFSDIILWWFPFYWLFKCAFHIWCFAPIQNNGSIVIYNRVIRPNFLKHQEQVDNMLGNLAGSAAKLATQSILKSE